MNVDLAVLVLALVPQGLMVGPIPIPWSAVGLFITVIGVGYSQRYETRAAKKVGADALLESTKATNGINELKVAVGRIEERLNAEIPALRREIELRLKQRSGGRQ